MSQDLEKQLEEARELHKFLYNYKNQEYPEKLLQINNLRKKLADLNELNEEEKQNLEELIKKEKILMKQSQIQESKDISNKISTVRKMKIILIWFTT
jgi:hypothetical protein